MYSCAVSLTIQCIAALVEIFAEEGLFCIAFMCRNAGRKSNDLDFRRLVLVWSLKLLQAFGGFTSSSLAIYNPKIRNLFSIPSMYDQNLWDFPNVPTYRTSQTFAKGQKISLDIMNYRFLTTETNLKALYIFCCFLQPIQ